MDFPIADLLDEGACYRRLLDWLHPKGLACPRCSAGGGSAGGGLRVHRRRRDPVIDYRCGSCGRVFNAFTGTALAGTRRPCSHLLLIVRGIARGETTAAMARELGCRRPHLLELRHRLQANAAAGLKSTHAKPLEDRQVEADEMYQNAGEKRGSPRPPRRPAAPPRQPRRRAGQLGA